MTAPSSDRLRTVRSVENVDLVTVYYTEYGHVSPSVSSEFSRNTAVIRRSSVAWSHDPKMPPTDLKRKMTYFAYSNAADLSGSVATQLR